MSNIIKINNEKFLLWKSYRKLTLFTIPELNRIQRFHIQINSLSCTENGIVMILAKKILTFLKLHLSPLRFIKVQQQFLQWQPIGGLCLTHVVVLFDFHLIALYDRNKSFSKSWAISVIQQIFEIKASKNEKIIGMRVKQFNNILYLWNMEDISSKPNQQIVVSQDILQWEFANYQTLVILSKDQFRVYLPSVNANFYLQYCIKLDNPKQFCWLQSYEPICIHSSRRSAHTIAVLTITNQILIYQLYDIIKRVKSSLCNFIKGIQPKYQVQKLVIGYQTNNKLIFIGQFIGAKPFCWEIEKQRMKYAILKDHTYKKQLVQHAKNMQYYNNNIIAVYVNNKIELFKLHDRDEYQYIKPIAHEKGILLNNQLLVFIQKQLKLFSISEEKQIDIEGALPQSAKFILQSDNAKHFVAGVRFYKLENNKISANGIVIKNPNAKLLEANSFTKSLLYKIQDQHVLMEYSLEGQKITTKNVKSSQNRLISLRKSRWLELRKFQIIFGKEQLKLASFDLAKMYKSLHQQNSTFDYQVHWTTHLGIILIIKNYVFILQLIETSQGYSLSLLKKGHSYWYKRFSPNSDLQLLNPRQFVFRVKNRIIRLGNKIGNMISQDPYFLPQTILQKQLNTRKFYPPHHPKIITYLIQCGEFELVEAIFQQLYHHIQTKQPSLKQLYQQLNINFFLKYHQTQQNTQQIKAKIEVICEEDTLNKLSANILENPSKIFLEETNPFILQKLIQALIFKLQNNRSLDYCSSIVMTEVQLTTNKNLAFDTRKIAFLLHSNNKQQVLEFIKPEKVLWDWLKKYSIPLWYNNVEKLKKWIQQIAATSFRRQKQPFDCLLWYLLIGKKTLLINLFKSSKHSSKQHLATMTFLERDFADQKNKSAAIKNAYVLLDKKRFQHALAFFVLGQKYQQCISVCLSRLNDFSLAYMFCLMFNMDKSKMFSKFFEEGDVWAKHIAYNLMGCHIDSFNCLFEEEKYLDDWNLQIKKTCFHPAVKRFSEIVQISIGVKRQLQQQQIQQNSRANYDIFDSFFSDNTSKKQKQIDIKPKKHLQSNSGFHLAKIVQYCLLNNFPCLALMYDPQNKDAQRAYQLQQLMLIKKVSPSVEQILEDMENILGLLQTEINNKNFIKANNRISKFLKQYQKALNKISLVEYIKGDRIDIGANLYYSYHAKKIIELVTQNSCEKNINLDKINQYLACGKVLISLQLKCYYSFDKVVQSSLKNKFISLTNQIWDKFKSSYNLLPILVKTKTPMLMDCFEYGLTKFRQREEKPPENTGFQLKLDTQQAIRVIFNQIIVRNLAKDHHILEQLLNNQKNALANAVENWIDKDLSMRITKQFDMIKKQGALCRLKLYELNDYFGEDFEAIALGISQFNISKDQSRQKLIPSSLQEQKRQKQGVEVFKNKQDNVRNFIINKNQGHGIELGILFKKGLKKIQVCESLSQRNRSKDGYYLIHQDPFYNSVNNLNFQTLIDEPCPNQMLRRNVLSVLKDRKLYDNNSSIRNSVKRGDPDFLRSLDPVPYIDHNQLNSIEAHFYLPIFLVGGKGLIEVIHWNTLKNFNRIQCPTLHEIVKLCSFQNRVTALDQNGNLGCFNFDSKYTNKCVFSLSKKSEIIDFSLINPSILATISNNSVQVFDTLLHPNRQSVFKIKLSNQPTAIKSLKQHKLAVLRKNEILIYDIRRDILQQTKDVQGEGKSLATNYIDKIIVGRNDSKVKIFDLSNDSNYVVKMGKTTEKKISIDSISMMGSCAFMLNSEGSIFLLDQI